MTETAPHREAARYDDTIRYDQTSQPALRPKGRYHSDQIVAHWTIVSLVVFQYITGPQLAPAFEAAAVLGSFPMDGVVVPHATIGLSILALMIWRVSLRRRFGAPPPPDDLPRWLQIVSRATHYTFYVFLLGMPLAGLAALITGLPWLGTAHAWGAWLLPVVIALHVAGAMFHVFRRDGVILRILNRGSVPRDPMPPAMDQPAMKNRN